MISFDNLINIVIRIFMFSSNTINNTEKHNFFNRKNIAIIFYIHMIPETISLPR